ncbi:MAG TPA: hypothetical protein DCY20_07485, partial [Firmicutes bacterium]|nr:hypothetical protein [Bacillota bacterium]
MGQFMKNIEIFVDGHKVNHTELLESGTLFLTFNVSSLDELKDKVTLNMTISIMGKLVSFRIISELDGVDTGGTTEPDE